MTAPENAPAMTTKPSKVAPQPRTKIPARAAAWAPDPRWAHPLAAAGWTYVTGYVPALGVPALAMGLVAPVLAVAGVVWARKRYPAVDYGEGLPAAMSWLTGVAAVAAAAWLVYAGLTAPLRSAGWLLLAVVALGAWYALLYTSAPKAAAEVDRVEAVEEAKRAKSQWAEVFRAAGLTLEILRSEATRAGVVLAVQAPDGAKPVSLRALQDRVEELTVNAAALLAKDGVIVREGDIRLEKTEAADIHLVHVCTKHVLGQTIPYVPLDRPTTIMDPIDVGLYEDGAPVELLLDGENAAHGLIIGMTGSGKTTLANAMVGRIGECADAIVGVVGSSKLIPFVWPWLRPWLEGKTERPAIDFVAGQHPMRVLEMLAELYRLMRDRNDQLDDASTHVATADEPAIVVLVEETGDIAKRSEKIRTYDGREMSFSALIDALCAAGRSALIHVIMLNQSHLHDGFGPHGAEIDRNTPLRICLKTMSHYDGASTLTARDHVDTTKLRDHSMLVQPPTGEPRVLPAKSYSLPSEDVGPVAIINAAWRPEPAFTSTAWADRWSAERLPELAERARRRGLTWPGATATPSQVGPANKDMDDDDVRRAFEQIVVGIDGDETTPEDGPRAPSPLGDLPDAGKGTAELDALAGTFGQTRPLPDLLAAVMDILEGEGAPTDWVPTRELAMRLGRVERDGGDKVITAAAQKLGRELSTIDEAIRSEPVDRVQCYSVPKLRQVAARIARGEPA